MRKLAFVILSSALLSVAAPTFAASDEKNEPPSIIVQGEGKAYAKPTLATSKSVWFRKTQRQRRL